MRGEEEDIPACAERLNSFAFVCAPIVAIVSGGNVGGGGGNGDVEEMNACTTISLKKSNGGDNCNEESWQRGRGRRQHNKNNDDEDKDHNNNTTIKQCTGERGAVDDGGNRHLAFGDVDDDRRQQIKALGGEDNDGGLGRRFGRGGG